MSRRDALRAWLPHPSAWISALVLFAFSTALGVAMGIVLPLLFQLARYSPRLAILGGLLAWLSPIPLVALGHRMLGGVLDVAEARKAPAQARVLHWWAGLYAWLVMFFATSTTGFVMLILDPPRPRPDALADVLGQYFAAGAPLSLRGVLWIVVAAGLYQFERVVRASQSNATF